MSKSTYSEKVAYHVVMHEAMKEKVKNTNPGCFNILMGFIILLISLIS